MFSECPTKLSPCSQMNLILWSQGVLVKAIELSEGPTMLSHLRCSNNALIGPYNAHTQGPITV